VIAQIAGVPVEETIERGRNGTNDEGQAKEGDKTDAETQDRDT
jgi:hypothetical protein